jgi:hypothetical protein
MENRISMKKIYFILLLLMSTAVTAEQYVYDNEYAGISVGRSSIEEVIMLHGEPNRKSEFTNDLKFHYNTFHVTFQNNTDKSNKVLIFDTKYIDANGIKIGTSKTVLEAIFNKKIKKSYLVDRSKGLVYWLNEGLVSKIVLIHELTSSPELTINGKEGTSFLELPNGNSVLVKSLAIKDVIPAKILFSFKRPINPNGAPVEAKIIEEKNTNFKEILILSFYYNDNYYEKKRLIDEANLILPYVEKLADNENIRLISVRPTIPVSQYVEEFGERIFYVEARLFFYKTADDRWVPDDVNPE